MYYYIVKGQYIGQFLTEMPSPNFVKLTDAQMAFYNEHPNASVTEVVNCAMAEPYVQLQPTLQEIKEKAIMEIDEYSRNTMGQFVDSLQLANAQCSLLFAQSKAETPIYDTSKAQEVVDTYLRIGNICRTKYHATEDAINAASSDADVDAIVAEAKSYYDNIQ